MPRWLRDPVLLVAALTALAHVLIAPGYGIFRDELYYLACGEHLAWGYVDHPPLVALVAAIVRATLGTSMIALRLLPALAAGATAYLGADLARTLGGNRFAQVLAAAAIALSPIYVAMFTIFSMNAFDILLWAAAFALVARLLITSTTRGWLALGVVLGLGLENKVSILYLGLGLGAGLLTRRDLLRTRGPWLAAALAGLLFAPHVIWQAVHGWPTLEFIANARAEKMVALSPLDFVVAQVIDSGPISLLWLVGLGFLFTAPARAHRPLALGYLVMLGLLALTHAKPYYLAPAYTALIAAGAVAVERMPRAVRAFAVVATASSLVAAPLSAPILPVDAYVRYADALGQAPSTDEHHDLGRLPQFFADMHGWRDLAATVARVHATLPADTCVFASNYGEAGAIDLYTSITTIAGHNSYHLWGPGTCSAELLIIVGAPRERLAPLFDDITLAATHHCTDCMPYENDLPIWIVRRPHARMGRLWPAAKHFI